MGKTTGIEWTHRTWNPWQGCTKVSDGCKNCYMYTEKHRYRQNPFVVVRSKTTFYAPLKWKPDKEVGQWRTPELVFTCSWSDWFHEAADPWRDEAWDIIRRTPHLTYQILTKRPELIAARLPKDWGNDGWPNVWLGTSVENEKNQGRVPLLLEIPARLHFLSLEPLLGPVSLFGPWHDYLRGWDCRPTHSPGCSPEEGCGPNCGEAEQFETNKIGWVIAGGESGPRCRPMEEDWLRVLRDQCAAAGTPFLLKQLGGDPDPRDHDKAVLDGITYKAMPAVR